MNHTRTRKIFRDIWSNKFRSLLVTVSIFVGVLGIATLTTMGQLLTRQLNRDLDTSEMAMLRVFLQSEATSPISNGPILAMLREQPGVTQVEGQAVYEFRWRLSDDEELRRGQLYSYSEPFGQIELEPVRLLRGRFPKPNQHEVAIEQRMADRYGLTIGDKLAVNSVTVGEQQWTVVGIVFQSYIYFGDGEADDNVYMTYSDAQSVIGFAGYSSIYARFNTFANARQFSPQFRNTLNEETSYNIVVHLVEDPNNNPFVVGVEQFRDVLLMLALIAMIVASFLVTNVLSIIMAEQRRQIGAMKALGASRLDILYIYLGMTLVFSVVGTLFGLGLGLWLGLQAARATAPLANTIIVDTTVPSLTLWLSLGLGLGVPCLAALIPIINGMRTTILEAMSDFGISEDYHPGLFVQLMNVLKAPPFITQPVKNVLRRKSRLALSFLSLMVAAGAFMGMLSTFSVLNTVINDIRNDLQYNINFDLRELQVLEVVNSLMVNEADEVRAISPGIAIELQAEAAAPSTDEDQPVRLQETPEESQIIITAIDTSRDLGGLVYTEGLGWQNDPTRPGIVISPQIARRFNVTVGDSLTLRTPDESAAFEIIGIADYPIETAFMEWRQLAEFVGTIRDAPQPNTYWEPLTVNENELIERDNIEVWAVGIDENLGQLLVPGFSAEEPGVIISQSLATTGEYAVGDEIALQPRDQNVLDDIIEQRRTSYPILGIVDLNREDLSLLRERAPDEVDIGGGLIAMHWSHLADLVALDYAEVSPTTFRIDLAAPEQGFIDSLDLSLIQPAAVYSNEVGFADRVSQTIVGIGLIMNLASLLMAVVGGIGLLAISMVGIWERQREIGVMRTLGATSRTIFAQFLLEGVVIGVMAWLAGVPLSYYIARLLLDSIPFHEVIRFSYAPIAPAAGLGGMLLVTVLATIYPAWQATQRTVSDILRYA